jgi:hypothetical protein
VALGRSLDEDVAGRKAFRNDVPIGGKGEGGITAKEENEPRSALIEIGPDFLAHSLIVEKKVHCGISG